MLNLLVHFLLALHLLHVCERDKHREGSEIPLLYNTHTHFFTKEWRSVVCYVRLLTGLSSPSSTSSLVKSLKQSLRVTSPEAFCGDTEHVQSVYIFMI